MHNNWTYAKLGCTTFKSLSSQIGHLFRHQFIISLNGDFFVSGNTPGSKAVQLQCLAQFNRGKFFLYVFPYLTLKYSNRTVDCCPANYLCDYGRNLHLIINQALIYFVVHVSMPFSFSSSCPPWNSLIKKSSPETTFSHEVADFFVQRTSGHRESNFFS